MLSAKAKYYICADSEEQKREWIAAINAGPHLPFLYEGAQSNVLGARFAAHSWCTPRSGTYRAQQLACHPNACLRAHHTVSTAPHHHTNTNQPGGLFVKHGMVKKRRIFFSLEPDLVQFKYHDCELQGNDVENVKFMQTASIVECKDASRSGTITCALMPPV